MGGAATAARKRAKKDEKDPKWMVRARRLLMATGVMDLKQIDKRYMQLRRCGFVPNRRAAADELDEFFRQLLIRDFPEVWEWWLTLHPWTRQKLMQLSNSDQPEKRKRLS